MTVCDWNAFYLWQRDLNANTYNKGDITITHTHTHTQQTGWQRQFINTNREFVSVNVVETPDKSTVHWLLQTRLSSTGRRWVFSVHVMKAYSGEEAQLQSLLISALDRGKWLTSTPGRFTPGSYWIEGRMGPHSQYWNLGERKISYHYQNWNPGPSDR